MIIELIIYPLAIIASVAIIYGIYKVIWYAVKMLALKILFLRMGENGVKIESRRKFFNILFGKKGEVDFVIKTSLQRFEVSVIAFVSTHGRWNFEKGKDGYYVECRRASSLFYKRYINTAQAEHAEQYKRESRIKRERLYITPKESSEAKQVLLLYPYPKCVTHTDSHYNELYVGDRVAGYEIMNVEKIKETVLK